MIASQVLRFVTELHRGFPYKWLNLDTCVININRSVSKGLYSFKYLCATTIEVILSIRKKKLIMFGSFAMCIFDPSVCNLVEILILSDLHQPFQQVDVHCMIIPSEYFEYDLNLKEKY